MRPRAASRGPAWQAVSVIEEQDIPKIVQAPLALGRGPPDQVGIWGGVGDDDIREGRLAAVVLPD